MVLLNCLVCQWISISQHQKRQRRGRKSVKLLCLSTWFLRLDDDFRKPETGMWDFMVQTSNDKLEPDLNESFYVGGHAGTKLFFNSFVTSRS